MKALLKANGMAMKLGTIIDATIIAAPSSTSPRPFARCKSESGLPWLESEQGGTTGYHSWGNIFLFASFTIQSADCLVKSFA